MDLLLTELHAHTTWSDGTLPLHALVDLYGSHGFDVLCVTDHTFPSDGGTRSGIGMHNWRAYVDAIDEEAARAGEQYGMLVIPGLELSDDHLDPLRSAHALAIGLRRYVSMELGLRYAIDEARRAGAAIVAAHPHAPPAGGRATARWWNERDRPTLRADRYELVNRRNVYGWIAEAGLPCVASGDFHRPEHLHSWKTLLGCEPTEEAVVRCLRFEPGVYLAPHALAAARRAEPLPAA